MRNKALILPSVLLAVAVVAVAVCAVVCSMAQVPVATEGVFPFSITYELDGETVTVNDVYTVSYDRENCRYLGRIGDREEDNTLYLLRRDDNGRIELCTQFYPLYMMGDAEYDYFDGGDFAPQIVCYDAEENAYTDEATLAAQGVKLIAFDYPTPNDAMSTVSRFSRFRREAVIPMLLAALLALVAVIVFVRKDKSLSYKSTDKATVILNFVLGFTLVPFASLSAVLIDINGSGADWYCQVLYFIPAFSVLCIAASVALRRKGYSKSSLIACLAAPAVFALFLLVCGACGLL